MKNVCLAAIALIATVMTAATSQAAFVKVDGGNASLANNQLNYGVYQSTFGSSMTFATGVSVGAGDFLYIYQVSQPVPPGSMLKVIANNDLVKTAGVIGNGFTINSSGDVNPGSTGLVAGFLSVGTDLYTVNYTNFNNFLNRPGAALFLTSGNGPGAGGGSFFDGSTSTFGAPVPVPLPGALGLFALGLPALAFARRTLSKK